MKTHVIVSLTGTCLLSGLAIVYFNVASRFTSTKFPANTESLVSGEHRPIVSNKHSGLQSPARFNLWSLDQPSAAANAFQHGASVLDIDISSPAAVADHQDEENDQSMEELKDRAIHFNILHSYVSRPIKGYSVRVKKIDIEKHVFNQISNKALNSSLIEDSHFSSLPDSHVQEAGEAIKIELNNPATSSISINEDESRTQIPVSKMKMISSDLEISVTEEENPLSSNHADKSLVANAIENEAFDARMAIRSHDSVTTPQKVYAAAYIASTKTESGTNTYAYIDLYEHANQLKDYAEKNGFNTRYACMINMGIKSGKKRFFVVDLENMAIVKSALVAHGRGDTKFTLNKKYSNEYGSNCTSLGFYRVGKSYKGIFGPAYRLEGLDSTNSNAAKRAIVLHAMNSIPDWETGYPIFQTEGCPAVSPKFLKEISNIINQSEQPMLLWIFDPEYKHNQ